MWEDRVIRQIRVKNRRTQGLSFMSVRTYVCVAYLSGSVGRLAKRTLGQQLEWARDLLTDEVNKSNCVSLLSVD